MNIVHCANCIYYDGDDFGVCRRYPPKVIERDAAFPWNYYTVVKSTEWCGEGQEADEGSYV